jgi:hypothetical protein
MRGLRTSGEQQPQPRRGLPPLRPPPLQAMPVRDSGQRVRRFTSLLRAYRSALPGLPARAPSRGGSIGKRTGQMIDLRIDPTSLTAGSARIVTLRLSNSGTRTCTNLVLALDVPNELGLEQGRSRLELSRLDPGEVHDHTLRIRPSAPGMHTVRVPNLSFRNGYGKSCRERGRFVQIRVEPAVDAPDALTRDRPGQRSRRERPSVFMSYRRSDSKMFVPALVKELEGRKGLRHLDFFLDLSGIRPSALWRERIDQELRECNLLIAVIGPNWLTFGDEGAHPRIDDPDDPVRREISTVLARGIPVLPLLIDTPMPRAADLPPSLRRLRARQSFAFDLARYARSVKELSEHLGDLLAPPPTQG